MRKIVINGDAGQCGTDFWEFWEVPDDTPEEELGDFAWQRGKDNAEMYGIYPADEYAGDEEVDIDSDEYSDNIEGYWVDYDPKKHDGHTMTGTPKWEQY